MKFIFFTQILFVAECVLGVPIKMKDLLSALNPDIKPLLDSTEFSTTVPSANAASRTTPLVPDVFPEVSLDNGDLISGVLGINGVETFKGIPYAEPPVGDLRFRHPLPYNGSYNGLEARKFGPSCINVTPYGFFSLSRQTIENALPHFNSVLMALFFNQDISEDCLTVNVFRPNGTAPDAKLPVMVWIHGGAFQFGSAVNYPGDKFIVDSISMGQPVIFVTMNYRLGSWGFLGGKAVKEEGSSNAGLYDQRVALRWVSDHIEAFGGDSNKITLIGESAGAISIAHHMVANDGDNSYKGKKLFHAAVMQSGGPWSFGSVTSERPETLFRRFTRFSGCATDSSNTTMACLRRKSVLDLQMAQNFNHELKEKFVTDPSDPIFGWSPRYDEGMISDNPARLIQQGKFTKIPYITGTQEDEGTVLTLLFNLKTPNQVNSYMKSLLPNTPEEDIDRIIDMYPNDGPIPIPGRKKNGRKSGVWRKVNEVHPGYLRFAEMIGDFMFQVPRLVLLENTPAHIPHYVFRSEIFHRVLPVVGTPHAGELPFQFKLNIHPAPAYRRYFISFANSFDPNNNTGLHKWKPYTERGKESLVIKLTRLVTGADEVNADGRLQQLIDQPRMIEM